MRLQLLVSPILHEHTDLTRSNEYEGRPSIYDARSLCQYEGALGAVRNTLVYTDKLV